MINKLFCNGILVISSFREKLYKYWNLENGDIITNYTFEKSNLEIECIECKNKIKIKSFYSQLNNRKYTCYKCLRTGIKNPFYGKRHSDEFKNKLSQERKNKWYTMLK